MTKVLKYGNVVPSLSEELPSGRYPKLSQSPSLACKPPSVYPPSPSSRRLPR